MMPHENRRIGKPVERLRRKATGPVIWQPAALSQPYRTWASPQGAVDSQSTKRRALYQPFGRCGALFALCGHSYILGVNHKRRAFSPPFMIQRPSFPALQAMPRNQIAPPSYLPLKNFGILIDKIDRRTTPCVAVAVHDR